MRRDAKRLAMLPGAVVVGVVVIIIMVAGFMLLHG